MVFENLQLIMIRQLIFTMVPGLFPGGTGWLKRRERVEAEPPVLRRGQLPYGDSLWDFEIYPALCAGAGNRPQRDKRRDFLADVGEQLVAGDSAGVGITRRLEHPNDRSLVPEFRIHRHECGRCGGAILPPRTETLRSAFVRNELVFFIPRAFGQILADSG
ncbi:MAG: hypothetical protein ACLQPI_07730 [Limisphaerales bacterium]